jgi:hypothetical protein
MASKRRTKIIFNLRGQNVKSCNHGYDCWPSLHCQTCHVRSLTEISIICAYHFKSDPKFIALTPKYGWNYWSTTRFRVRVLAPSPLRLTTRDFNFQLNTCGYSPYVTSSVTRGQVCRLQLLLAFTSAVILRSECRGSHDHILLSQIRDSPNFEGQVIVFISPGDRVARLYPQALGSFFVNSYDSQGYVAGIRPRLHTELHLWLHPGLNGQYFTDYSYLGNACWKPVSKEMQSWFPRIHLHGNVFVNAYPSNGSTCHIILLACTMITGGDKIFG